jgi:hypothetical protein
MRGAQLKTDLFNYRKKTTNIWEYVAIFCYSTLTSHPNRHIVTAHHVKNVIDLAHTMPCICP